MINEPLYSVDANTAKCHELLVFDKFPAPPAIETRKRIKVTKKMMGYCAESKLRGFLDASLIFLHANTKPNFALVTRGLWSFLLSQLRLHCSTSSGDVWFVISTDTKFRKALSWSGLSTCMWGLRPLSPPLPQDRGFTSCFIFSIFAYFLHQARLKLEQGHPDRLSLFWFRSLSPAGQFFQDYETGAKQLCTIEHQIVVACSCSWLGAKRVCWISGHRCVCILWG